MSHHVVAGATARRGEEPADGDCGVFGMEESPVGLLSGKKAAGAKKQGVGETRGLKRGGGGVWGGGGGGGAFKEGFF